MTGTRGAHQKTEVPSQPPDRTRSRWTLGGGMARAFYRLAYRAGRPRWDGDEPLPELVTLLARRRPGRALDLGCGTGANALYLARQGWEVTGVDFAPEAVERARRRETSAPPPSFVVGDVTRLRQLGVEGPFDLVLDVGCFHGVPDSRRGAYAAEVAAVCAPGADLYLAGIADPPALWRLLGAPGVGMDDLERHFGTTFTVGPAAPMGGIGRHARFVLHRLTRSAP